MTSGARQFRIGSGTAVVLALLPTLVLLCLAEMALRLTGAAERCPTYRDDFLLACDPILYFKPNPHQVINGTRLNSAGFRSREFAPKRPGTYRVLALGDSCTFGVISPDQANTLAYIDEPYPQRLERIGAERLGPGRIEVLNAGAPGYNSFQGVMLLRTKLRSLQPDLITVRFGWNDHLMSPERHIGNAFHEPATPFGRAGQDLLLRTALYPFSQRLGMMLQLWLSHTQPGPSALPPTWEPTIPIDEYKHNLARIVELGRAQGAAVWLLTSPGALDVGDVQQYELHLAPTSAARLLLYFNALPSLARLAEIHEAYNAATRQVGAALGVPVIDMEAVYRDHAGEPLFSTGDVLHPTQQGHDLEAEALYTYLRANAPTSGAPLPPS